MREFVTFDVVNPQGIVQVYRNYWWWCVDGDPTKAIFYKTSSRSPGHAQCNSNKEIAQGVGDKQPYPVGAQLVQIPLAFVPWET